MGGAGTTTTRGGRDSAQAQSPSAPLAQSVRFHCQDLSSLNDRFCNEQRHRPAEPTRESDALLHRPNVPRLQRRGEYAEPDERECHNVAAEHPLLVLLVEMTTDREERKSRRRQPCRGEAHESGAEDPATIGMECQIVRS